MMVTVTDRNAVLFDLDGTLVDSMWMWDDIDVEYLGRRGLAVPPTLKRVIEGMSFTETAIYFKETFGLPDSVDAIKAEWNGMAMEKYRTQVPLKPGAGAFLKELKRRHIPMGIATSNSRELVDAVLTRLSLSDYFQNITTACEVASGKPAPDIYLAVAQKLGAAPGDCIVFEDVPAGILAGKNAGMQVCAVDDAFSAPLEAEKRALADDYIKDYWELLRRMEEAV